MINNREASLHGLGEGEKGALQKYGLQLFSCSHWRESSTVAWGKQGRRMG